MASEKVLEILYKDEKVKEFLDATEAKLKKEGYSKEKTAEIRKTALMMALMANEKAYEEMEKQVYSQCLQA